MLQRTVKEKTTPPEEEEDEEEEEGEEGKEEGKEEEVDVETADPKQPDPDTLLKTSFYNSHSETLIPVLLRVSSLMLSVSHQSICVDLFNPQQDVAPDTYDVATRILSISATRLTHQIGGGGKLPSLKNLFIGRIPVPMSERLKLWNSASVNERTQLDSLCFRIGEGVDVLDEIFGFLHSSFRSICGSKNTYSPNTSLKTVLFTTSSLLLSLFSLSPVEGSKKFFDSLVPLATDLLMEFAVEGEVGGEVGGASDAPLKEMARLFDEKSFGLKCMRHKVMNN